MSSVSGAAAIAWFRSQTRNSPGMCLNTVWQAYGSHNSIGPFAGQYPDAMSGWNHAARKHPGDFNPPAGVPVYFGVSPTRTDANARAGDVVLSLGGGRVIGTDVGGAGRIGETTIAARAAAISRPYLGWTEDFLGYDVDGAGLAASSSTPLHQEDDDMAKPRILNMRQTNDGTNNTSTIFFDGGPGIGIKGISSPAHLVLLERYIADKPGDHMFAVELAIVNAYLAPNTPTIDASPVVAAVTAAIKSTGVTVDTAAIAKAVDATLADNFAAIPASVANEEAKRLSS